MALRNLSNNLYNTIQPFPTNATAAAYQFQTAKPNNYHHLNYQQQQQQQQPPQYSNYAQYHSSDSSGQQTTSSTSTSSSSQIRTSSPISSPTSSEAKLVDLDKLVVSDPFIRQPIRFQRAVNSCQNLPRPPQPQPIYNMNYYEPESAVIDAEAAQMQKYPSMRELAYRKLREVKMMRGSSSEEKIKSKGRLKLAVYANTPTHLTVNIIEAVPGGGRMLSRGGGSESSLTRTGANLRAAYVRITQIPEDAERRLVVKTRIIEPVESNGNKYHFNDKFSFEICQLNPRNRLVIALWTISNQSNSQGNF